MARAKIINTALADGGTEVSGKHIRFAHTSPMKAVVKSSEAKVAGKYAAWFPRLTKRAYASVYVHPAVESPQY